MSKIQIPLDALTFSEDPKVDKQLKALIKLVEDTPIKYSSELIQSIKYSSELVQSLIDSARIIQTISAYDHDYFVKEITDDD